MDVQIKYIPKTAGDLMWGSLDRPPRVFRGSVGRVDNKQCSQQRLTSEVLLLTLDD